MSEEARHVHGWILQIQGTDIWFEPIPGEYSNHMTCRRQALKATEGNASRIVVMVCKGEETCPSKIQDTALAT